MQDKWNLIRILDETESSLRAYEACTPLGFRNETPYYNEGPLDDPSPLQKQLLTFFAEAFRNSLKAAGFKLLKVDPDDPWEELLDVDLKRHYDFQKVGDHLLTLCTVVWNSHKNRKMIIGKEVTDKYHEAILQLLKIAHNKTVIENPISEMTIVSHYMEHRLEYDETVKIRNNGWLSFKINEEDQKIKGSRLKIDQQIAVSIIAEYRDFCLKPQAFSTDDFYGNWELTFVDENGQKATYEGPMGTLMWQSDSVNELRKIFNNQKLVIGGAANLEDIFTELTLKVTFPDRSYEELLIRRADSSLRHTLTAAGELLTIRHMEGARVDELLQRLNYEVGHFYFPQHYDLKDLKDDRSIFELHITHLKSGTYDYCGYYDKADLSPNWPAFIGMIYQCLLTTDHGAIFDPNNFARKDVKNMPDEHILCRVILDGEDAPRVCLCDDPEIKIFDTVAVYVGDNELKTGEVIALDYYAEDELPAPLEAFSKIAYIMDAPYVKAPFDDKQLH